MWGSLDWGAVAPGQPEVGVTVKKLLTLLVLVGLLLAAGAYWMNHTHPVATSDEGFTYATIEFGTLTETVGAIGQLQPHEVVAVGSGLSGQVVEIGPEAEINRVVEEGQVLLKLDDRPARMKLDQAKTAVRLAQADVGKAKAAQEALEIRVQKLKSSTVSFEKDVIEAEAQLKAAIATVRAAEVKVEEVQNLEKQAQYALDQHVIRVPNSLQGPDSSAAPKRRYTIIDRKVVLGQLVAPPASAQLFTLASDLGQMQVHAQVSENDIGKIQPGLDATFTTYAYSEDEVRFKGRVVEIGRQTTLHGTVAYDTLIDAANDRDAKTHEWRLRPGMTATVNVILRQHSNVWKVPTAALSFQLDEHYQSEAARAKLRDWQGKDDWKPVWIMDEHNQPWPIFVRIGGKNGAGETGIKDSEFNEVLEWDPQLTPKPDPKQHSTYPQVLTGAPPVAKRGLFERANVKLF